MKKFKKVIAMMLVVMTIGSMVACGSSQPAATSTGEVSTSDTSTSAASTTQNKLEPYEISWFVVGGGQQKDTPLIEEEVNKYLKDKINATLKITTFDWGTYQEKVSNMIAAGESMDIFFTCGWLLDVRLNALKGALLPMNDLIDQYAPKTKELLGKEFLDAASINGKLYAIPANKEKAQGLGILFKKDLLDKYKMDISNIKSIQDCEPLFETIKKNEPGIYPIEASSADSMMKLGHGAVDIPGPGCAVADDGKTVVPYVDNPYLVSMYNLEHEYYKKGYIRKDSGQITDTRPDVLAGKYFSLYRSLKPGKDVELSNEYGYQVKQVMFGKPTILNGDLAGSMQGISRTSKDPARVMMFLELFNTDKYLNNLINYGIEGKHYVKVSDNVIDFAPETDGGKNSGYNPNTAWMFGNVFLTYLSKSDTPDKWQQYEDFNKSAVYAASTGFYFNPEAVKNEVAAMANVDQEFSTLNSGALDPAVYIPKWKAKLQAAGLDKVIAECQKQFDEWRAANGK